MNSAEVRYLTKILYGSGEGSYTQETAGDLLSTVEALFLRLKRILEAAGVVNVGSSAEGIISKVEHISNYGQEIDALKVALDWALEHVEEGIYSKYFRPSVFQKEREAAEAILVGNYSGKEVGILRGQQ